VTNRLADATSPYLLQHKDNPVDWWPWGDEAFEEARRRDLPVFLSIGYAACHWCHVMAHESFEDQATADQLNHDFISIKVDREERPDVDSVYMAAVQGLTGQGGWPMTVFLDPQRRPFHAGTYFPREPRAGMPSFTQLLTAITTAWTDRRDEIENAAAGITESLAKAQASAVDGVPGDLPERLTDATGQAVGLLAREFDHRDGGFGGAPKFPPSSTLEFLLRYGASKDDPRAIAMVEATCEAMARGGIYDQLAGGFARYSVDAQWVVPHFEKMLYDNALLLRVYAHWYRATGSEFAARITRETAEFLLNDLRTAQGGFASALDADAPTEPGGHSHEGASYAWRPSQIRAALGDETGALAIELLNVTNGGTFEHGSSVLQLPNDPDGDWWPAARAALRQARDRRPQPARDDKVVAAWNGIAIAALAEAGVLLEEPSWIDAAIAAARLIEEVHVLDRTATSAKLLRVSRDGLPGTHAGGVLEDYGDVTEGLLALSAVTGDQQWRELAGLLLQTVLEEFSQPGGGFFDTPADGESLIMRPSDPADLASPSGWSAATSSLLTYGTLVASERHLLAAEAGLVIAEEMGKRSPRFAGWLLASAQAYLGGPLEVVIVGADGDPQRQALLEAALRSTSPGLALAVADPANVGPDNGPFTDRPLVEGRATAYVCRRFVCSAPITTASDLVELLNRP